jgi:hypothetical protein
MKAAQIDVVERTTQLLAGFNLSTAAPELGLRLENAGQRDALLLVLEVLEMEAEAREQRKITGERRAAQIPPGKPSRHWTRTRCQDKARLRRSYAFCDRFCLSRTWRSSPAEIPKLL